MVRSCLEARATSFQQRFVAGHVELAHDTVELKIILQSRTSTKQNKHPSKSTVTTMFFISIVVAVHAVALAIVIVAVAGRAGILRIIQLLALEQTVKTPALSTKFTTSSMQDKHRKVLASSA
jgi:hypothetical protein